VAKELPKEWTAGDKRYIKVPSMDKEANDKLKKAGAVIVCTYFDNKGTKTFNQYSLKRKKDK
jgi:hypothetical protein